MDLRAERGQRLDFGRDVQPAVGARPVERLHAGRVAGEQHRAGLAVDEREGELAAELEHRVLAPGEQRFEDDLGVGLGPLRIPLLLQACPQLVVVEDLAVVAERPAPVR